MKDDEPCARPDENGEIHHGRGCYVVSADGGGVTFATYERGGARLDALRDEVVAAAVAYRDVPILVGQVRPAFERLMRAVDAWKAAQR